MANLTSITQRYSYQYDPAGNRTSQQVGNTVTNASHNNANQLTNTAGGGKLLVAGNTNEPAKVTVNGKNATVTPPPQNLYQAWIDVTPGANTITIAATDYAPTPNTTTKSWSVNVTGGTARAFTYDTNGNTLTDGLRSYQWDAEDRLVKITQGANVYEFTYDSSSRRVSEKVNGTLTRRWLWDGPQIAEERDAAGTTITKRYYAQGEQRLSTINNQLSTLNLFYTRDHLGSIREMTDSTAVVRVRYDYDPYGKRTKLSGDLDCDLGFTGHYYHAASSLSLTLFRAYDADLGRWLSADPIGEAGGINLYGYVRGNPILRWDPLGLVAYPWDFVGPLRPGDYHIPQAPPGVDTVTNCRRTEGMINPWTFKNLVKAGAPWDFKVLDPKYEDYGNFHYGATGRAFAGGFGFTLNELLQEAGRAQMASGTGSPAFGKPAPRWKMFLGSGGTGSNGDEPKDQIWIERGWNWYGDLPGSKSPNGHPPRY